MKPIYVLFIYGDILRHGGIENFMMNYFRYIDSHIVHIDFAVQGENKGLLMMRLKKPEAIYIDYLNPVRTHGGIGRSFQKYLNQGNI